MPGTDAFVNWLTRTLGNVHQPEGGSRDEYIADCPKCGAIQRCSINPVKRVVNCYRCGGQGLIQWLQAVSNLTGNEILALIEDRPTLADFDAIVGTLVNPIPVTSSEPEEEVHDCLNDFAALGVDRDIDSRVSGYLQSRGFTIEYAVAYGLCYAWRGRYQGRLIIPVYEGGRLIYFQARSLFGEEPKYLNPRVPKGQILFGFDTARSALQTLSCLFICEGAFNALSLGPDAVAVFGTTMSAVQQAKVLQILTDSFPSRADLVVAFDHGAEGKAVNIANRFGVAARQVGYLQMPDDRDLNDHFIAGTLDVRAWTRWV